MLYESGFISRDTGVVSGVPSLYRLDVQQAHLLSTFRDCYSVIGKDFTPIKHPVDFDRRIAFRHRTADSRGTVSVGRFVTKLERQQYGRNCKHIGIGGGGQGLTLTKSYKQRHRLPITFNSDVCSTKPALFRATHV